MHIRDLLEYAILKYLRDNPGGANIDRISSHVGMGDRTAKRIVYKLVGENKVDFRKGLTDKNYSAILFYEKRAR